MLPIELMDQLKAARLEIEHWKSHSDRVEQANDTLACENQRLWAAIEKLEHERNDWSIWQALVGCN